MANKKLFLGLSLSPHDTAAAIVQGGKIICVAEQERFDRERHSHNFPKDAIDFCLKKAGVKDINDLSGICVGYDLMERAKARFEMRFIKSDPALSIQAAEQVIVDMKKAAYAQNFFEEVYGYKDNVQFYDHYDSHAASCYYPSPFKQAAILIIDGAGERHTTRIYAADGTKLKRLFEIEYPNSLGRFYGWITDWLGFRIDADEGKTMGLASYGTLKLLPKMRKLIKVNKNGGYDLNMEYFNFQRDSKNGLSEKFFKEFGRKRKPDEPITQHHKDVAKAAQYITEEAVLGLAKLAKRLTKETNLCLSGGVILNSVANGKIAASGLFKDMYIYPAAGDAGTAVGAALHGYFLNEKKKEFFPENQSPYLGYEASEKEILKSLKDNGLIYRKCDDISKEVAQLLSENKIVAWYQGKAEIGPRALGNRSILADARLEGNKDLVNATKKRESWRPFAPSVLKDHADEYFEMNGIDSPYMILTQTVRKNKRKIIPAITHIDGTARVQTVTKERNPEYWEVINEFYKLTGVPVILNTSFNLAGEPIVNTPGQAIKSFLNSKLDVLAIEDYLVIK
jgi:carbamoyltransferase